MPNDWAIRIAVGNNRLPTHASRYIQYRWLVFKRMYVTLIEGFDDDTLHRRRRTFGWRSRINADKVRAKRLYLVQDILLGRCSKRHKSDNRRDTNNDTEHREDRTHFASHQATSSGFECISKGHDYFILLF